MEEVGELHVDGPHWTRVLHDPVFVHIRSIVVTWGAKGAQRRERERERTVKTEQKLLVFRIDGA